MTVTTAFHPLLNAQPDAIIAAALRALEERLRYPGAPMSSPATVRDYLRLHIAASESERFMGLWLDAQNRLIAAEELFAGTLTQTSVYPREVVKRALSNNAAAVIFAHNHPSGLAEPSNADQLLTETLKRALDVVDVRALDHFIVGGDRTGGICSFAERGLI